MNFSMASRFERALGCLGTRKDLCEGEDVTGVVLELNRKKLKRKKI